MKGLLILTLVTLIIGNESVARADWQYTKWGMSVEAVKIAGNGAVTDNAKATESTHKAKILLRGTYKTPTALFDTAFFFAGPNDGLDRVNLSQRSAIDCAQTLSGLREKYGPGESTDSKNPDSGIIWRDERGGNAIKFSDTSFLALHLPSSYDGIPAFCIVSYQPLNHADSNGL